MLNIKVGDILEYTYEGGCPFGAIASITHVGRNTVCGVLLSVPTSERGGYGGYYEGYKFRGWGNFLWDYATPTTPEQLVFFLREKRDA